MDVDVNITTASALVSETAADATGSGSFFFSAAAATAVSSAKSRRPLLGGGILCSIGKCARPDAHFLCTHLLSVKPLLPDRNWK